MNRASSSIAGVNSVVNFNALMTVSTNRCLWIEWMRFLNIVFAVAKTSVWRLILRLVSSSICTGLTMHKLHKFYWMNQCQLLIVLFLPIFVFTGGSVNEWTHPSVSFVKLEFFFHDSVDLLMEKVCCWSWKWFAKDVVDCADDHCMCVNSHFSWDHCFVLNVPVLKMIQYFDVYFDVFHESNGHFLSFCDEGWILIGWLDVLSNEESFFRFWWLVFGWF